MNNHFFASDYFEQLYDWAVKLIKNGKAYVDDQPQDLISQQRGTPTRPGTESPFRNRSVEENLQLFEAMKRGGDFPPNGSKVLRAKVDMASPNMHMRDPVMYRILNAPHHAPATNGRFIRCTTTPTANQTTSKASPIRFVRWNLKYIAHSTTGFWISLLTPITVHARLNLRAST